MERGRGDGPRSRLPSSLSVPHPLRPTTLRLATPQHKQAALEKESSFPLIPDLTDEAGTGLSCGIGSSERKLESCSVGVCPFYYAHFVGQGYRMWAFCSQKCFTAKAWALPRYGATLAEPVSSSFAASLSKALCQCTQGSPDKRTVLK